jgi:hypothetical protein
MKCTICYKEIKRRNDYFIGIKNKSVTNALVVNYSLLFQPYAGWLLTGKLRKKLDENVSYLHNSCYKKLPVGNDRIYNVLTSSPYGDLTRIALNTLYFLPFWIVVIIYYYCGFLLQEGFICSNSLWVAPLLFILFFIPIHAWNMASRYVEKKLF